MCVCPAHTLPCPSHIAKFLLCESHYHQSQILYHRMNPSGFHIGRNLWALGWGDTVQPNFYDGFPCLQTSVQPCIVMLKQDFCWIFVRLNLFERLPEFCHCLDVGFGVYCLSSRYHIHWNHSFTVPEDSDCDLGGTF